MLLIALGVVAVVALVLGLLLASSLWLVVSLVASLVALLALYVLVRREGRQEWKSSATDAEDGMTVPAAIAETSAATTIAVRSTTPGVAQAGDDPAVDPAGDGLGERSRMTTAQPGEVLVVDEHPEFHANGCAGLASRSRSEVMAIPRQQALEDGFVACTVCAPDQSPAPASPVTDPQGGTETVASGSAGESSPGVREVREVWVADGHPEFHVAGCGALRDLPGEAIPYDQAVEDGFVPCGLCQPADATVATSAAVPAAVSTTSSSVGDGVWVVDGEPAYHLESCRRADAKTRELIPRVQALEDGFVPCTACAPEGVQSFPVDEVWVVDGYPEFHVAGCHELNGRPGEPIPRSQAIEDGFIPCATCRPAERSVTRSDTGSPGRITPGVAGGENVWVVDGLPSYHVSSCKEIAGLDGEPVPRAQAVGDEFVACTVCNPDGSDENDRVAPMSAAVPALPIAEPAESAEPTKTSLLASLIGSDTADAAGDGDSAAEPVDQVLVVDGFPEFHLSGCRALAKLNSQTIPFDQAVGDGFRACVICAPTRESAGQAASPEAQRSAAPTDITGAGADVSDHVWVVDGQPSYHRENCLSLAGVGSEPIPHDQATDDGFAACEICRPDAASPDPMMAPTTAAAETAAAETSAAETDATSISEPGPESEPEPVPEPVAVSVGAIDPGAPSMALTGEAVAASHAFAENGAREVYVLDGRPRFHAADCLIIKGQDVQPLPYDEAVSDGFRPCSLCSC